MSSSLVPTGGLLPSKLDRQVSRALARIDGAALVASHQDQVRLDRVATTTERGMIRAAQIGALEGALVQSAPQSVGYVHAVACAGAVGIAAVVYEAGRGL
jgi:hypothetical protein